MEERKQFVCPPACLVPFLEALFFLSVHSTNSSLAHAHAHAQFPRRSPSRKVTTPSLTAVPQSPCTKSPCRLYIATHKRIDKKSAEEPASWKMRKWETESERRRGKRGNQDWSVKIDSRLPVTLTNNKGKKKERKKERPWLLIQINTWYMHRQVVDFLLASPSIHPSYACLEKIDGLPSSGPRNTQIYTEGHTLPRTQARTNPPPISKVV